MGCFRHTRWTHPQILNFPLHAVMRTIFTKSLSSNRLQYLRPHNVTDECHYRQIRQFFLIVLCQTHILLFLLTRSRTNMNKEYILPVILKSGSVRTQESESVQLSKSTGSARLSPPASASPSAPKTRLTIYAALPLEHRLYHAIVVAHFPQDVDNKEV